MCLNTKKKHKYEFYKEVVMKQKEFLQYKNVLSNEEMFSENPAKTKEIDGVKFIEMAYSPAMKSKFWFRYDAVKRTK